MSSQKTVDNYVETAAQWQAELRALRKIILTTNLEETIKWGMPYYSLGGKNIVGMASFKSYFGLWFTQGVFLKDEAGILTNAKEGTTRALRQWRMSSKDEINSALIKSYVIEAIEISKAGKAIKPARNKAFQLSPELRLEMENNPALKSSYDNLSQFQKREYSDHINSGLNDKYRT